MHYLLGVKFSVQYMICSYVCRPSLVAPLSGQNVDVYSVIPQEEPAWLFHSENLYRLHLSQLPPPVLAFAAKPCSTDPQKVPRKKSSSISKIIDHFVSERNIFIPAVRNGATIFSQDRMCIFVDHTERLYGASVAALLRGPPF